MATARCPSRFESHLQLSVSGTRLGLAIGRGERGSQGPCACSFLRELIHRASIHRRHLPSHAQTRSPVRSLPTPPAPASVYPRTHKAQQVPSSPSFTIPLLSPISPQTPQPCLTTHPLSSAPSTMLCTSRDQSPKVSRPVLHIPRSLHEILTIVSDDEVLVEVKKTGKSGSDSRPHTDP